MPTLADLLGDETLKRLQEVAAATPTKVVTVTCIDCTSPLDAGTICVPCARQRIVCGQPVQTIHNPGGPTLFDIDSISDAELGALVRQRVKAVRAGEIIAASPQVEAQRAKHEVEETLAIADRQAERVGQVHTAFKVGDLVVPALDLTQVTDLNEVVDGVTRSPYNKARHRLKLVDLLDAETTTYAVLAEQHEHLRTLVTGKAGKVKAPKAPKKAKAAKESVVLAVTETDPAVDKKAAKLAKILDCSLEQARELVNA